MYLNSICKVVMKMTIIAFNPDFNVKPYANCS